MELFCPENARTWVVGKCKVNIKPLMVLGRYEAYSKATDQHWLHHSQVARLWWSSASHPKDVVLKFMLILLLPILFVFMYLIVFYGLFHIFPFLFFGYYGKSWLMSLGGERNNGSQSWIKNACWLWKKSGFERILNSLSKTIVTYLINWQTMNFKIS